MLVLHKNFTAVYNDSQCVIQKLPKLWQGAGALLNGSPLYCGGTESGSIYDLYGECYLLQASGEWVNFGSLQVNRMLHSAVAVNNEMVWFTGGNVGRLEATSKTEVVYANGTITFGPTLPYKISGHCMVKTDDRLIYIIAMADIFTPSFENVLIYNDSLEFVDAGPAMVVYNRMGHGCNVVYSEAHGGRQIIVVAGGGGTSTFFGPVMSVEILDYSVIGSYWTACRSKLRFPNLVLIVLPFNF